MLHLDEKDETLKMSARFNKIDTIEKLYELEWTENDALFTSDTVMRMITGTIIN